MAVVLALLASVGYGAGDFVGGLKGRSVPLPTVLVISQVAALVLACLVLLAVGPDAPDGRLAALAAAAGAFQAAGLGAYYAGLAGGAMGVVAPISATAAVIPVTVGIVLGEQLGLLQAIGIAVAILGIVVTSAEPKALAAERPRIAVGVGLALLAAANLGLGLAFLARASEDGDVTWAVVISRAVLVALVCVTVIALRHRPTVERRDFLPLVSVGLLSATATFLFAEATTHGLISLVAVIVSVYPVTTIGLAWLVLGERVAPTQRMGAVIALAGVALIAA